MPTSETSGWQSWQPQNLLEESLPIQPEIMESLPPDLQSDEQIQAELARLYQQAEQKGMAQGVARGLEEGKQQGYEDGFNEGRQQGIEQGRQEALAQQQEIIARFTRWCEEFRITLDNLDSVIPARLVQLALTAVRSMMGKSAHFDNAILLEKIQLLLQQDRVFKGAAQLWVHPDDEQMVGERVGDALQSLGWELRTDKHMVPGGCRLTSEEGEFDATLTTSWQELCQLGREDCRP